MADISTTESRLVFDFKLSRDGDETSRSISLDDAPFDSSREDAAKAFREQMLLGSASASTLFGAITPNTLVQPANWRDGDVTEEEWTTTDIEIKFITTTTITVDTSA